MAAISYGSWLVRAWERDGSLRVVIEAVQSGRTTELRDGPAQALLDALRGRPPGDQAGGPDLAAAAAAARPPRERD